MQQPIASEEQMRTAKVKVQELLARVQGLPLPTDSTVSVSSVGTNSSAGPPAGKQPLPVTQMAEKMVRTARTSELRIGSSSGNGGGRYVPPSRGSGGGNFFGGGVMPLPLKLLLGALIGIFAQFGFNAADLYSKAKAEDLRERQIANDERAAKIPSQRNSVDASVKQNTAPSNLATFSCETAEKRDTGFAKATTQEIASPGVFNIFSGCALVRFSGAVVIDQVLGDGTVYIEDVTSTTGFTGCAQGSAGRSSSSCESFITARSGQVLKVVVPQDRSLSFSIKKGGFL